MPLLIGIEVGLQFLCAVHVLRTGRPTQWLFVIMLLPVAGCLAYLFLEILPEMRHSRAGRQVARDIGSVVNPDGELRRLTKEAMRTDTVQNKFDLAKECNSRGRFEDARELLEQCLTGVHADDPNIMMALARSEFGLADYAACCNTLERLREANPDYQSSEGHLMYARAMEGQGKDGEALAEYAALTDYYPGEEARCRYAQLLQRTGQHEQAESQFRQVVNSVDTGSKAYFRAQREWYELAQQRLDATSLGD